MVGTLHGLTEVDIIIIASEDGKVDDSCDDNWFYTMGGSGISGL